MNKKSIQHGFTLIELLFATAILGFMLTITLVTFIGVFRFYTWSGVTRTNQAAARETLDSITRVVQSGKLSSLSEQSFCVTKLNVPTELSTRVSLSNTSVLQEEFTGNSCEGDNLSSKVISSSSTKITGLVFTEVIGALGVNINIEGVDIQKSIIVNLTTLNGRASGNGVDCDPADNFCDKSSYTTAINSGR